VRAVLSGGLTRRWTQTIVIAVVVLVSTGASVLGLALAIDSSAPFDDAFAAQRGADVSATIDASSAELAATARLPQVTAADGPYDEVTVRPAYGAASGCVPSPAAPCGAAQDLSSMILAGRASPDGPVDDLTLQSGRWAQRPGQIVLSTADTLPPGVGLAAVLTVAGVPLTVVGFATSVTGTAGGWVAPAQVTALHAPVSAQMLYRFRDAATTAAIHADVAAVTAALPAKSVTSTQSYLTVAAQEVSGIAPIAPFLIVFGITGLVVSVLIVINVVSGAVVAGYRRIGVLKCIGFTPGQVAAAYTTQAVLPAVAGCLAGLVAGNLVAAPLLGRAANAYQTGVLGVPAWADAVVALVMCGLAAVAALVPAVRAGRMSAVSAIAAGRAPGAGRGLTAQRLLGALPLPRPVTIGFAAPFARPARAAVTLAVVMIGAAAVTLAAGLSGTLGQVVDGLTHSATEQVQVSYLGSTAGSVPLPRGGNGRGIPTNAQLPMGPAQQRTIAAALRAQAGTSHYVAEADEQATMTGLSGPLPVTAFLGNASWTGYGLISGRWYTGDGQADVSAAFRNATGASIGDTVTITFSGQRIPVRIVGEIFERNEPSMVTGWQTLAAASPGLAPAQYDVGLRPGTSPSSYAETLDATLGTSYSANVNDNTKGLPVVVGLVAILTLLLAIVAGLGVLNTVSLMTRDRVHDLGVFKAIGMTPRQTIAMVICWVTGTGLVAGVIAVPAGIIAQRYLMHAIVAVAGSGLPASFLNVYHAGELVALVLAGVVIAAAGALLPATWAARSTSVAALRAE
jgi:putative ABC transport system permease protein